MAGPRLLPNGMQQFFGNDGEPLALGHVEYFIPGTDTHKTTWQDQGMAVQNTNPIDLDDLGRCVAWGSGLYRQVVTDADDVQIWDEVTGEIEQTVPGAAAGGSADAYTVTLVPALSSYAARQCFTFTTANSNTGASTINVDGLGVVQLYKVLGGQVFDLSEGDILAGRPYFCLTDGTNVEVINPSLGLGPQLLQSITANGGSTITFDDIPEGFNSYEIRWRDCSIATDNARLRMQVSVAGVFSTTGYSYVNTEVTMEASPVQAYYSSAADSSWGISAAMGNNTGEGSHGVATISAVQEAPTAYVCVRHHGSTINGSTIGVDVIGSGMWTVASTIDGIRLSASSGAINFGVFELWGIP